MFLNGEIKVKSPKLHHPVLPGTAGDYRGFAGISRIWPGLANPAFAGTTRDYRDSRGLAGTTKDYRGLAGINPRHISPKLISPDFTSRDPPHPCEIQGDQFR